MTGKDTVVGEEWDNSREYMHELIEAKTRDVIEKYNRINDIRGEM